jgi:hypothetical protein
MQIDRRAMSAVHFNLVLPRRGAGRRNLLGAPAALGRQSGHSLQRDGEGTSTPMVAALPAKLFEVI